MQNQLYREVYNFHAARLAALRPGIDFLEETVDMMTVIAGQHPGDKFCIDMLCAVCDDIERRWMGLQGA